jgi:hypothetical protein
MEKTQGGTKFISKFFGKQPENKAGEDESLGQEMLINVKAGIIYFFFKKGWEESVPRFGFHAYRVMPLWWLPKWWNSEET